MRGGSKATTLAVPSSGPGCVNVSLSYVAEMEVMHLSSLRDGETTRKEILRHLGDLAGVFEDGRILTFRSEVSETSVISVRGEDDRHLVGVLGPCPAEWEES